MPAPPHIPGKRLAETAWLSALPLALNAVSVVANGYIIRRLGDDGYGTIVVALGLTGVTTILANLGMRALYTKAIAGADDETIQRLMAEQLALRLLLGTAAAAVAVALALLLYPRDIVVVACTVIQSLGLVLTIGWTVLADVLNARERFRQNATTTFISGLALTGIATTVAALGGGPAAVAAAYLVGPLVNLGLQWRSVRGLGLQVRVGHLDLPRFRALLSASRALAANDLLSIVRDRLEGIWAPLLFGKAAMGVHSAGMLPAERLSVAPDGAATAYFPSLAAAHARGEMETVRAATVQMFTLMVAITLPLGLFTWFGAPYLAGLLFPGPSTGNNRDLATFIARTSALILPLSGVGIGMRYALQAIGEHSRNARDQMRATVVGALVALPLALTIGIRGLVIASVVKALLGRWMQEETFRRHFPGLWTQLPWRQLGVAVALQGAILVVGIGLGERAGLPQAIGVGLLAGATYTAAIWGLGVIHLPGPIPNRSSAS